MINGVTKTEGSITVFHLKDDLNVYRVKAFLQKMNELIESGRTHIVLELSNVEEICLMGMVSISTIYNKCRQLGGGLKVAHLTPEVRQAFRETNLINTVEVYDELLEAIKSYRSQDLLKVKAYSGSFYLNDQKAFVGWDRLPMGEYFN